MKLYATSRRFKKWVLAGGAALAIAMTAQATQTVTTPNSKIVTYNLAAGAISAPITVPLGVPVQVMGVQLEVGNRGVGYVSILCPSVAPQFIEWTGIESPAAAAITSGFSATLGTHILYLDYAHTVDIEVNDATTIRVHNTGSGVASGRLTVIW